MNRVSHLLCLMTAAIGFHLVAAEASAANFPTKPVTVVVPFAPGGAVDSVTRVFAERLQAMWKQPVTVVNKAGGNTVPAVDELRRAPADGYAMLADNPPASSMLEIAVKGLPFDISDRTYVAMVSQTPMMIIVSADSPYKTLVDAVADIKRDPTTFTWTSLGGAGAQDAVFRLLFKAAGVDVAVTRAIRLKGGAEAVTMTAGGHIKMGVGAWSAVGPALSAKTIRVLAVTAPSRFPATPDVPTTAELGLPSVEVVSWQGFSAPRGLSADIAAEWTSSLKAVLAQPETAAKLLQLGVAPFFKTSDEMKDYVLKEREVMREIFAREVVPQ